VITPNLMVSDLGRAVAFYRNVIGMELQFVVGPDQTMQEDPEGGVFATLDWNGGQLMLQTTGSLAEELDIFAADQAPAPGGTIYFRGLAPEPVLGRLPEGHLVRAPFRQWYGMREAYLTDPDGHVLCLAVEDGPAPD